MHPDDQVNGSWNLQFSDFQSNGILSGGGDQGAAILIGRCYMIDQNGKLYGINSETSLSALLNGDSINQQDINGNFLYRFDYGNAVEVY